jgi:hypothetical protein
MFNRLGQILKNKTLNNYSKQEEIEIILSVFWKKEIEKLFEGKISLFSSGYGINLIKN